MPRSFRRPPALAALVLALALALQPFGAALARAQAAPAAQLRLVRSDTAGVVLELEIPGYEAQAQTAGGVPYLALSVPGLSLDRTPGRPLLPVAGTLIGVPPGAQPSLRIVEDTAERAALAYPPLPAPTEQVNTDPAQPFPTYAGSLTLPDAAVYAGTAAYPAAAARILSDDDWRSQRVLSVALYPLQYDPAQGQVVIHRRLRVAIDFNYPAGVKAPGGAGEAARAAALGGPQNEGPFDSIFQGALLNYASAKDWRAAAPASLAPPGLGAGAASGGPWYKIAVNQDGLYRLDCTQLNAAGLPVGNSDFLETLKLYTEMDGDQFAVRVAGSGACDGGDAEYFEFFGQAVNTKYTDTNIYWLTYGGAPGLRMATRSGSGTGTVPATFTNSAHVEQNHKYYSYAPYVEGADHWYWNFVPDVYDADGNTFVNSADYTFQTDQLAATASVSPTLTVNLTGLSSLSHVTNIYLNNLVTPLSTIVWSGGNARSEVIAFPQSSLLPGLNTLRVEEVGSAILVNSFDVTYASNFTATGDSRRFRQTATNPWEYHLDGFTTADIDAFDITNPLAVTQITPASVTGGGPYTVQFFDSSAAPREYLALTAAQRKTPVSLTLDTASDLQNESNQADYIIIAPGAFIADPSHPLQDLAAQRASQGMTVMIVDIQDVYDEFSRGLMDAQAIRDFLNYTYHFWQDPAPSFALLVGDGTYDYRNYEGLNAPTYIPAYLKLVDPWIGETASDNRLVAFNDSGGNTLPLLSIGRLPANSTADVQAMVAKILSNEQSPPAGAWRNTVSFVTDNAYSPAGVFDAAGNFWALSDEVAGSSQYKGALQADRIYYNPCDPNIYAQCSLPYSTYLTPEAVRAAVVDSINNGRVIVNYVGHAAYQEWASEALFGLNSTSPNELDLLTNSGQYPVFLSMTCFDGSFHIHLYPSLAESLVRQSGKGALASWSASGLGVGTGHDYLDRGFFNAVVNGNVRQIGLAAVAGKANLWANSAFGRDLVDTFNLLGDPASRLNVQLYSLKLPLVLK